mmetsp:Transcript_6585/g.15962  ORF Transcript_6585/g.15962 Transcript_6585/m.15962 type:complete len:496 (+) Transcript_6585:761-2248(+)
MVPARAPQRRPLPLLRGRHPHPRVPQLRGPARAELRPRDHEPGVRVGPGRVPRDVLVRGAAVRADRCRRDDHRPARAAAGDLRRVVLQPAARLGTRLVVCAARVHGDGLRRGQARPRGQRLLLPGRAGQLCVPRRAGAVLHAVRRARHARPAVPEPHPHQRAPLPRLLLHRLVLCPQLPPKLLPGRRRLPLPRPRQVLRVRIQRRPPRAVPPRLGLAYRAQQRGLPQAAQHVRGSVRPMGRRRGRGVLRGGVGGARRTRGRRLQRVGVGHDVHEWDHGDRADDGAAELPGVPDRRGHHLVPVPEPRSQRAGVRAHVGGRGDRQVWLRRRGVVVHAEVHTRFWPAEDLPLLRGRRRTRVPGVRRADRELHPRGELAEVSAKRGVSRGDSAGWEGPRTDCERGPHVLQHGYGPRGLFVRVLGREVCARVHAERGRGAVLPGGPVGSRVSVDPGAVRYSVRRRLHHPAALPVHGHVCGSRGVRLRGARVLVPRDVPRR